MEEVTWAECGDEIFALRQSAWSGQSDAPTSLSTLTDAQDASSHHFVGRSDGRIVAAIRISTGADIRSSDLCLSYREHMPDVDGPFGIIGRLVVAPEANGAGLAGRIINHVLSHPRFSGHHRLAMSTNRVIEQAMRNRGFIQIGPRGQFEAPPWDNATAYWLKPVTA